MDIFISMTNKDKWDSDPKNREKILKSKREWYYRNKKHVNDNCRKQRKQTQKWLDEFKLGKKCIYCEENHLSCLDFHHLDRTKKKINISVATQIGWSIERIKEEIDKCILICSNCHRKLHWHEKRNLKWDRGVIG